MTALDHLLWAAPDLDDASRQFEALTGVRPIRGGEHPGRGTRNSLVSLGDGVYFEIITPDPAQTLTGTLGERLARLPEPGLLTFALSSNDLPFMRQKAVALGLKATGPESMSRKRPGGSELAWSILNLEHETLAGLVPFALDWGRSRHPSRDTPSGCRLTQFAALHSEPETLRALYANLGAGVEVMGAAAPGFLAVLDSPKGKVVLRECHG